MLAVGRRTLDSLDVAEREQIENAIRTGAPEWWADESMVPVWVLSLLLGLGIIVCSLFELPLLPWFPWPYALAGLALMAWVGFSWVTTQGRRGVIVTATATWLVRGKRLRGVRHTAVSEINQRRRQGSRKEMRVVMLHADDLSTLMLFLSPTRTNELCATVQAGAGRHVRIRNA